MALVRALAVRGDHCLKVRVMGIVSAQINWPPSRSIGQRTRCGALSSSAAGSTSGCQHCNRHWCTALTAARPRPSGARGRAVGANATTRSAVAAYAAAAMMTGVAFGGCFWMGVRAPGAERGEECVDVRHARAAQSAGAKRLVQQRAGRHIEHTLAELHDAVAAQLHARDLAERASHSPMRVAAPSDSVASKSIHGDMSKLATSACVSDWSA